MFRGTMQRGRAFRKAAGLFFAALALIGCQARRSYHSTTNPSGQVILQSWPSVHARVDPPPGWIAQPLKSDAHHTHQVWVSPTGDTAYGVIYFTLPLPVSADFVLPFFMHAMRAKEGDALLISKVNDPHLPGVRFEADGGIYHIQANLITAGFQGWSVYAGRLLQKPANTHELQLARAARERTELLAR